MHAKSSQLTLGYALNAFPYEDLRGMLDVLRHDAPAIKRATFPQTPLPIELRFNQPIVDSLKKNPKAVARIHSLLNPSKSNGFNLLTINGFVPLSFHQGRVKERVYLPAWNSPQAERIAFTNDCVTLLSILLDESAPFGSVSVPAGVLKKNVPPRSRTRVANDIALAITQCAIHAAEIEDRTGRRILIGLEPEPGLTCETTPETIEFFERHLWKILPPPLRPYIGVNFDLCHQLVEAEDPLASIRALLRHKIPLTKIHITNAIEVRNPFSPKSAPQLERLRRFYAKSKFLHQTVAIDNRGRACHFSLDLPEALSTKTWRTLQRHNVRALRIHYHMPLFESPDDRIRTTLPEVKKFLSGWKTKTTRNPELQKIPLIIETYTWLEQLRDGKTNPRAAMHNGIIQELRAVKTVLR